MAKNNNLELYEKVRVVPQEAKKPIQAGRLKGMTDINPMWRIKTLTEHFGMCGIGWYPEIIKEWIETVEGSQDIVANVEIKLYVNIDGEWSQGIPGIGGSKIASMEKNGLYVNDECYKSAYTDALSVACKALGIGADVYFAKDTTKYNDVKIENFNSEPKKAAPKAKKKGLDEMTYEEKLTALKGLVEKMNTKKEAFMEGLDATFGVKNLDDIELKDINEICTLAKNVVLNMKEGD